MMKRIKKSGYLFLVCGLLVALLIPQLQGVKAEEPEVLEEAVEIEETVAIELEDNEVEEGITNENDEGEIGEVTATVRMVTEIINHMPAQQGISSVVTDEESLIAAIERGLGEIIVANDFEMTKSAVLTIPEGTTITLSSSNDEPYTITRNGGRHFNVFGDLTLKNIILDGNNAVGGVSVTSGTLNLDTGSKITKCTGAALQADDGAIVTFNGGEVSYSSNGTLSGGGVNIKDATLIMYDGLIDNNKSSWGGGVAVGTDGVFYMYGGTISNNISTDDGGAGVMVSDFGLFIMEDGLITKNETTNQYQLPSGGGVYVGNAGTTAKPFPEDTISKFIMNGGTISENTAYIGGGVSAIFDGNIEINGGNIVDNIAHAGGGGIAISKPEHREYGVSLKINGGDISGNHAGYYGGGIWVFDSTPKYKLDIAIGSDNNDSIPKIHNNTAPQGAGIAFHGNFIGVEAHMYSGEIYDNTATSAGGGVYINNKSTFIMNGGSIYSNSATNGGGVVTAVTGAKFIMNSGKIDGNIADNGGGIYTGAETSAEINNAIISHNVANVAGGGMYLADHSEVTISHGDIEYNTSHGDGGGSYVNSDASFIVKDDTVLEENRAIQQGGGIYAVNHDYSNPVSTSAYSNLLLENSTVFAGNVADKPYMAPDNALKLTNIGYSHTSIFNGSEWLHPINNYDINYENLPAIDLYAVVYHPNGGIGEKKVDYVVAGTIGQYMIRALEETGFYREGYDFIDWTTEPGNDGIHFGSHDLLLVTKEYHLYAQWKTDADTPDPNPDPNPNPNPGPNTEDLTPEIPTNTNTTKTPVSPGVKTGDNIVSEGYLVLALLSTIIGILVIKKKRSIE